MLKLVAIICVLFTICGSEVFEAKPQLPVVVTTWKFEDATKKAWQVVYHNKGTALDAVESGCAVCEREQCDYTVGYGGSPDENGETTLDAMIMDGSTMNVGAVGGLRRIKNAVGVARKVLDNTEHTFLVGELATEFALSMGFPEESLSTNYSKTLYSTWRNNKCQPNFWKNVTPNPTATCGPYKPLKWARNNYKSKQIFGESNHDTIGMVAIDSYNRIAAGTSTNGAKFKVPGRVGDSPIAGAGSYADNDVGGAAATGNGDVMMRFLPSFLAVEEMRRGTDPQTAAETAVRRIAAKYPNFSGAVIALRKDGVYGAACSGMDVFPYTVASPVTGTVMTLSKNCQ